MIRSSAHSLRFTNPGKVQLVGELIGEYRLFVQCIINDIVGEGVPAWNISQAQTDWTSRARIIYPQNISSSSQRGCQQGFSKLLGKQAIMMLKAATEKRRKQLFVLANLQREGGKYKRLQSKVDRQPLVKPDASGINLELDSRFVSFQETDIFCLSNSHPLVFHTLESPSKELECSNKWQTKGILKVCVRISEDTLRSNLRSTNKNVSGSQIVGQTRD